MTLVFAVIGVVYVTTMIFGLRRTTMPPPAIAGLITTGLGALALAWTRVQPKGHASGLVLLVAVLLAAGGVALAFAGMLRQARRSAGTAGQEHSTGEPGNAQ